MRDLRFYGLKTRRKGARRAGKAFAASAQGGALPFPKGYKLAMQEASGIAFGDKEDE